MYLDEIKRRISEYFLKKKEKFLFSLFQLLLVLLIKAIPTRIETYFLSAESSLTLLKLEIGFTNRTQTVFPAKPNGFCPASCYMEVLQAIAGVLKAFSYVLICLFQKGRQRLQEAICSVE